MASESRDSLDLCKVRWHFSTAKSVGRVIQHSRDMFAGGWCPPVAQQLKEKFGCQMCQQGGLGLEGETCMK